MCFEQRAVISPLSRAMPSSIYRESGSFSISTMTVLYDFKVREKMRDN